MQQWSLNVPFRFVSFSDSYNQLQAKLEGVLRIQIRGGMGLMKNDKCLHAPITIKVVDSLVYAHALRCVPCQHCVSAKIRTGTCNVRWYHAQPFNTTVYIQSESKGKSVPLFLHVCFTLRGVIPSVAAPETAGLVYPTPGWHKKYYLHNLYVQVSIMKSLFSSVRRINLQQ